MDGSTSFVVRPRRAADKLSKNEEKTSIILLSVLTVLCLLLLALVIFIGGFKTNFFHRQFVKLGWVDIKAKDMPSYWCIKGWGQCLRKLDIDADIVFYGNSITAGSDFRDYFPDVSICNLGFPGDDLPGLRFRAYTISSVNPGKVFVMGGINGLNVSPISTFTDNYILMIKAIQAAVPDAKIYLQSILPVKDRKHTEKIQKCNIIIDSLATAYGCQYVDLFSLYVKDGAMNDNYSKDGTHLKKEHYDKWAEKIKPLVYE